MRRLIPPSLYLSLSLFFLWWVTHSSVLGWKEQYFLSHEIKAPRVFALNWSGCSSVFNTAVISVFPAAALASPPQDTQLISTSQHQKLPCLSAPRILPLQKLMPPPPTEVVWKDCQPLQIRAYSSLWLDLLNSGYKFDLRILDRTNSWNSHSVKKKKAVPIKF